MIKLTNAQKSILGKVENQEKNHFDSGSFLKNMIYLNSEMFHVKHFLIPKKTAYAVQLFGDAKYDNVLMKNKE